MRCPVCHAQNFEGDDFCANCGADLSGNDTPEQAMSFKGGLLGAHLDELGAPAPETISPDATVGDAIARMRSGLIDCLLVTERDRLIGIFTDRDALLKIAGRGGADRRIRDVMTADPVVLRHDDPIAVAIHKMAVGGFRHVPIVDHGRPIAVVSAKDVFRHIASRLT